MTHAISTQRSYLHPHEREEIEMQFSPRMWDATPGVCCAYFQTGACAHTEAFDQDEIDALLAEDEVRYPAWTEANVNGELPDEPF